MTQNVFNSLFTYRPREDLSSKENYLTELFAHVLRESPEACRAWIARVLRRSPSDIGAAMTVTTQVTLPTPEGVKRSIVDMVIECAVSGSGSAAILCEHKWDSPTNPEQLTRYLAVAGATPGRSVVFIAPTVMQVAEARASGIAAAFQWEDVFSTLSAATSPPVVRDFLDFLALQGLGPKEPLSWPRLAAHAEARGVDATLQRYAEKLAAKDWSFLPERLRARSGVEKRWGRLGVALQGKDWSPTVFVGFLIDGADHQLTLLAPRQSVDLMLSLDGHRNQVIEPGSLARKAEALKALAPSVLHGTGLQNRWRKIVVREPLFETIQGHATEDDQVDAIHKRLRGWCEVLFNAGELDEAMRVAFGEA